MNNRFRAYVRRLLVDKQRKAARARAKASLKEQRPWCCRQVGKAGYYRYYRCGGSQSVFNGTPTITGIHVVLTNRIRHRITDDCANLIALRRVDAEAMTDGMLVDQLIDSPLVNEILMRQAAERAGLIISNNQPMPPGEILIRNIVEQQQVAYECAMSTLQHFLSPAEQTQLQRDKELQIKSRQYPNRVYLIPLTDGVVRVLEHGQTLMTVCVRPVDTQIPWPDVMLAYKLGLEGDEDRWLQQANKWIIDEIPAWNEVPLGRLRAARSATNA